MLQLTPRWVRLGGPGAHWPTKTIRWRQLRGGSVWGFIVSHESGVDMRFRCRVVGSGGSGGGRCGHSCKQRYHFKLTWVFCTSISLNTWPGQNGRQFADDLFKCIFLNGNVWISNKISLKFVLMVQLIIFPHWFRYWRGADQAKSHYLNQRWLDYRRIYASFGLNAKRNLFSL